MQRAEAARKPSSVSCTTDRSHSSSPRFHNRDLAALPVPPPRYSQGLEGAPLQSGTYLALLQAGFTKLLRSPGTLVSSYLPPTSGGSASRGHLFTLTPAITGAVSLSVALSFPSPGLRITERLALWSSDFPPRPSPARMEAERLPVLLQPYNKILLLYNDFSQNVHMGSF
jgi:hypothetical protein